MMKKNNLTGVITALVTPFKNGEVDKKSFIRLLHDQMKQGLDGVVVGGTTGESPTLTRKEIRVLYDTARIECGDKLSVIVGTGSNSTLDTVEFTREVSKWGPDAVLVVVPYYNKPTQKGIIAHFNNVADASTVPVILYNVPGRTIVSMNAETIIELSQHPQIAGIKEASGSMELLNATKDKVKEDFIFLSGDDGTFVEFMKNGGHGTIGVASHIIGKEMKDLGARKAVDEFKAKYSDLMKWMYVESNPIPVKMMAHWTGLLDTMEIRLPLTALDEKFHKDAKACLKNLGKI